MHRATGGLAVLSVLAMMVCGCGSSSSSSLSSSEFKSKGNSICAAALAELKKLGTPSSEAQLAETIPKASSISGGELTKLEGLSPPSAYKSAFQAALAGANEVQSKLSEFSTELGEEKVKASEFTTLEKELAGKDPQINVNFTKAGLAECAREQQ